MNRPKKRKQKEDSDQSDPDSDEVGIDSGLEVQVDFEAHQPESEDYHGIKRLLNQVKKANLSDFPITSTHYCSFFLIKRQSIWEN
eukprot:m.33010 g.33010  ORF g.33010 m.33010 type:complete len:85 (+) comp31744_c0_seq1:115-369(+)